MSLPKLPDNINKRGSLRAPDGKEYHYKIVEQIHKFQSDDPEKAIVLQKILFDDGRIEIRLAYYIIGKKPKMKGQWVWGQFATLMPIKDFQAIYNEAKSKGWFNA